MKLPTDPTSIIAVQTASHGLSPVSRVLRLELGMRLDEHYIGLTDGFRLEELVTSMRGKPQLLITGIINVVGDDQELLQKLKKLNPKLRIVAYSSFEHLEGPYDDKIYKLDDAASLRLVSTIRNFLDCQLRAA
jgi:hypothetical protein